MPNITQTVHALTQGISQQPDEQKIPGQVKDLVNAIPNITEGLLKRPAGKFVASLSDNANAAKNSDATGRWFHYYRDENEQYIGQIAQDGTVKMWACDEVRNPITNALIHEAGASVNVVDVTTTRTGSTSSPLYTYSDGSTGTKYLKHTGEEDIQTLTLNDFTYINNRKVTVEMDTLIEPDTNFRKEMFIDLQTIAYARQYAVNLFSDTTLSTVKTATRIEVELIKSSNNYCNSSGNIVGRNQRINESTRCAEVSGDNRDAFAPNVGTRIFNVSDGDTLADRGPSNPNNDHTYTLDVKNSGGYNVSRGKNLYFRIATTGQSVPFSKTTGTGTNATVTTTYQARYTTTFDLLHGGQEWEVGDYFYVWMKDGYYKVTIKSTSEALVQANQGLIRPQPTPFDTETTITAESILGSIRREITGNDTASGNGFVTQQIGTGLYLRRPDAWSTSSSYSTNDFVSHIDSNGDDRIYKATGSISSGGTAPTHSSGTTNNWQYYSDAKFNGSTPVGELLNVVAGQVKDVGDLPSQCKHGMVVEVINSDADEDNYYVKFEGNNERDGEGVWIESAKPGRKIRIKRDTMPVALIRTADGNFRLTELDESTYSIGGVQQPTVPFWDDALVGDEDTNPEPSFVGKTINKMVFFRNRFAILAEENIVLSRAGDFTNFFSKSAIQFINSDPVDISASSEYPATLFDAIQVNTGLVLFSKNQQFMLTTDSDAFGPLTAKINNLSSYNFNFKTNPISLGTTVGFLDNAGRFSRFWEMAQIAREGEPQVLEQSAVVSRLFAKDLKFISNSRENSVIFFSEKGNKNLYGFRYFNQVLERKLASWFRWEVTGDIQYHCMLDDSLYVVVKNNNKNQLLRFAIKLEDSSATIDSPNYRVHLDHLMKIEHTGADAVTVTYNVGTNKSTFNKPVGLESTNQLVAYDTADGNQLGRYSLITVDTTTDPDTLSLDGDWSGQTFLIGYLFTMKIQLPTIYYVRQDGDDFRSDTRANTIVHRVKIGFGPVGLYKAIVKKLGRPTDYEETFEVTQSDTYAANATAIVDDNNLRIVPIYERNINADINIESTHPSPATIHNFTWEGIYTNNFYERV